MWRLCLTNFFKSFGCKVLTFREFVPHISSAHATAQCLVFGLFHFLKFDSRDGLENISWSIVLSVMSSKITGIMKGEFLVDFFIGREFT